MTNILSSLRLALLTILACCVVYPAALLGLGQAFLSEKADGSLVRGPAGNVPGSRLIAQGFTQPEYFWPRPSAANYDAAAAGGSNWGTASPALTDRARAIITRLDLPASQSVPADLVAASGSGLDPHISLASARVQVPRVAAARRVAEDRVDCLIEKAAESRALSVFGGEPVVNVLLLNLALDKELPFDGE